MNVKKYAMQFAFVVASVYLINRVPVIRNITNN